MRRISAVFSLLLLCLTSSVLFAADVRVKVLDPQSAAVTGADVLLLDGSGRVLAKETTSAEGFAIFPHAGDGPHHVKVLAAGFAAETVTAPEGEITIGLHLAPAAATVVVSATRTPVPGEAAGADIDLLSGA